MTTHALRRLVPGLEPSFGDGLHGGRQRRALVGRRLRRAIGKVLRQIGHGGSSYGGGRSVRCAVSWLKRHADRGPMDTWHAINSVRVVRRFTDEPVAPEHLERILNAGRRAGSSKNQQSWAFITIRDREQLQKLAEVGRYADHLAGRRGGDRPGAPGCARRASAALDHVGPGPRGAEHGPRRLGARNRQRAGDRLRPGARVSPARPAGRSDAATSSCRSVIRPTRRS